MAFREDINLNDWRIPGGVADTKNLTRQSSVPVVWDTFNAGKPYSPLSYKREEDFFEWCVGKAHSLDRSCMETRFEESSLDHEGLANALRCDHRGGSFAITPEAVARCHHVANVISVSCFLFCLRIGTFEDKDGSVVDKSSLIDHLASLVDKWKWSGEKCRSAFDQWIDYSQDVDSEMLEEALKLLYQWTLPFLSPTFVNVEYVIMRASVANDEYAEVDCASKWGDELCDFLEEYRNLFRVSGDAEFFYDEMYHFHRQVAELHLILGKHERAKKLLVALNDMLGDVDNGHLMDVTDWRNCKNIAYIKPNPIALLDRKINVLILFSNHWSEEFQKEREKCEVNREKLGCKPKVCYFLDWSMSHYDDLVYRIFTYFGEMRYSPTPLQPFLSTTQNMIFSVILDLVFYHPTLLNTKLQFFDN
jgi:hypothetical protein